MGGGGSWWSCNSCSEGLSVDKGMEPRERWWEEMTSIVLKQTNRGIKIGNEIFGEERITVYIMWWLINACHVTHFKFPSPLLQCAIGVQTPSHVNHNKGCAFIISEPKIQQKQKTKHQSKKLSLVFFDYFFQPNTRLRIVWLPGIKDPE